MRDRVVGDYAYLISDIESVRTYLRNKASMIPAYEWMDNSIINGKIRELATMKYKTGGATEAENAVANVREEDLREYVRNLIKADMTVGIAILKKQRH